MELNLFFAIVAPIAMIAGINWVLQRGEYRRPPFVMPADSARAWVAVEKRKLNVEAANDDHARLAA
jgi:hypothetical protein